MNVVWDVINTGVENHLKTIIQGAVVQMKRKRTLILFSIAVKLNL